MVDTKDQSNAIVYCICYVVCWHCQYWCLCNEVWKLYSTLYTVASNTIYVDTVDTKHIHTFLPITFLIFNRFSICKKFFWKLRLRTFQPYHQYYICQYCQHRTRISNAFNAICVDTVDTKHIHTFLPITFLIFNRFLICKKFWKAETKGFSTIPSILYMLILLILDISISNAFNAIYVEAVDTFSTQYNHM